MEKEEETYKLTISPDIIERIIQEEEFYEPRRSKKASRVIDMKSIPGKRQHIDSFNFNQGSISNTEKKIQIGLAIIGCLFFGGSLFLFYAFLCKLILLP